MNNLDPVAEAIRAEFDATNERRDAALNQSRDLIRHCSEVIRAVHRRRWESLDARLAEMRAAAEALRESVAGYPMLEHTGYTQDAFKEYVEALVTLALVKGDDDLPTPQDLGVLASTYLNGLAEAASELRRHILDLLREEHSDEVERLLAVMDTLYTVLFSFGYPDAVTGGLRRRVDQLRGVLERTRGDVTLSIRQERLLKAMRETEQRLGLDG